MSTVLIEWPKAILSLMADLMTIKGNTIKNAVEVNSRAFNQHCVHPKAKNHRTMNGISEILILYSVADLVSLKEIK